MAYYNDVRSYPRTELGVPMMCHVKQGGYTEIVARSPFPDYASIFDHSTFSGQDQERELRKVLRRHARQVKKEKG